MKVVFFGTPPLSAAFLRGLLGTTDIEVLALVCQGDQPVGRKAVLTPPATKQLFLEHHPDRPVFQPAKLKDPALHEQLRALGADAFVVFAYGRILPTEILAIPPLGCINVHPSLLPRHRGPSPLQAAILAGDQETGITIMQMDAGMDTGPIFSQIRLPLPETWSANELTEEIIRLGVPPLIETLRKIEKKELPAMPQSQEGVTVCSLINKEDGRFASTWTAEDTARRIRAYTPWPQVTYTGSLEGKDITIKLLEVQTGEKVLAPGMLVREGNQLFLGTTTTALEILSLQPVGKNPMSTADFLRGWR